MVTVIRLLAISLIALGLSAHAPALAQSAITDEAVAPSGVVLGCAASTAREMGYKVVVDSTHGQVTADKNLPLSHLGPDPTEYTRKNELAITTKHSASGGTTLTIIPKSIAVTNTRRGYTDVAQPSTPDVIADADTLIARCRSLAPNTSLPQ